jgi:uncharacterized protein (DUF1778 family)
MQPAKTKRPVRTATIQNKNVPQQSRLNFRLAPEIKERVARAAALTGQDLTEFAVATLSEKADEVLERHDQLLLGSEDYHFFLDALSEKRLRKPSERSRKAADAYRRGTRKGVRYQLAD